MQRATLPRPAIFLGLTILQACNPSASGDKTPAGSLDPVADQLLAGAARALGEVGRVKSLMAIASVKGPSTSFQSAVYSARDGRARLALGERFLAGVGRANGWIYDPTVHSVAPLDDTTRGVIRGHELHMMVLAPRTRWQRPQSRGAQQWAGEAAFAVEFRDNLGAPTTLYLRTRDTLPIGWQLVNHTGQGPPDVRVTLSQWEEIDGVRLFRHAVFAQDSARYVYDYIKIELNAVPDSMFEPPNAKLSFRPLTLADFPLLHQWRTRPHVAEWWPPPESLAEVEEEFAPLVAESSTTRPYVALRDGEPIGYIQSYVAMGSGDGWWPDERDPGVRGIDQFLAHPDQLNQGLGTAMVRTFVERLFSDPSVTRVQTDPSPENLRAIRCYEKAGFQRTNVIETPDGPALLMICEREDGAPGGRTGR